MYGAYTLAGAPVFDRVLSLSRTPQTCAFLVFLSDFAGYLCTLATFVAQAFGALGPSVLEQFVRDDWGAGKPWMGYNRNTRKEEMAILNPASDGFWLITHDDT